MWLKLGKDGRVRARGDRELMANLSKLRARLGSVKLVLAHVSRETHGRHSQLQRHAVEEMLKACTLTNDEKAEVATKVSTAGLASRDEALLLGVLIDRIDTKVTRRQQ